MSSTSNASYSESVFRAEYGDIGGEKLDIQRILLAFMISH